MVSLSEKVTPRIVRDETRATSEGGGGGVGQVALDFLGTTISSWDLEWLRRRLLEEAQEDRCWSSAGMDEELEEGTMRKMDYFQ